MISPLAAGLYCIAALCVALGLFSQTSFRGDRDSPFRFFNLFLYGLAIDSVGTALLTDALDLEAGFRAQRLQLLGQALALCSFCDFQQRATRDDSRNAVISQRVICGVITAAAASGWMLAPGQASPRADFVLPFAVHYPEVALSPLGYVAYTVGLLLVGRGVVKLRRAHEDDISKPMFYSFVLAFVGVGHDQLIRSGMLESVYLLEFSSLACMLAISVGQARRFLRESAALRRRTAELERSHASLQQARDALVQTQRLAGIGELSAVIAHEVRNPLGVIKNAAAGLRRRDALPEATRKELLGITDEEVTRLSQLVDDMLTYAKPLQPKLAEHAPRALVEAAIERARAEPGAPAIDVVVEDETGGGVLLEADAHLITQALGNVLSNALRASPTEGEVRVSIRALAAAANGQANDAGALLEFIVRDQGDGMDADTRDKAVEPFFTTRPRGTGLGLAISKRVARAHHGELSLCDNTTTSGTKVSLRLPLRPSLLNPVRLAIPPTGAPSAGAAN